MAKQNNDVMYNIEQIAETIPCALYWFDINYNLVGVNQRLLKVIGAPSKNHIVGKTLYDFYPKHVADGLQRDFKKAVELGHEIEHEHVIEDITTYKSRYFAATVSPIKNYDGEIIGGIGSSIETTNEKEAEQLKLENQRLTLENKTQKIAAQLEEHKKFRKVADQMAHDLGSPLMALSVLENSCAELPEAKRNMLRESISSIREIAGSLLSQYKPSQEDIKAADKLESKELLVYAVLQHMIMDKQYEYQHLPVKFECEYTKNSIFSFVKSDLISFKRMLSNLINNAVEAIDGCGKVLLKLDSDNEDVRVSIIDNGQGMSEVIIDKIMNNTSFTSGKEDGHGIGYSQIHETLEQNQGKLSIDSKENAGTVIELIFPKMPAPEWIAEEITLKDNDTILILDDENSIHGAWDIRFNEVLKANPNLEVKHFTQAIDVINFVDSIENKDNIVLLSDYELLRQKLNGLDVIERTMVKRSVLVTSHYTDIEIRRQAYKMDTKILPKILASEIQISVV